MTPADLKTQRQALGLSQKALADIIGYHALTIHYWETGKRPIPGMMKYVMMALVFEADMEWKYENR